MHRPRTWCIKFLDRTNVVVTGLTATFILCTRSAAAVYFAIGALLCSITVKIIKRSIRQPRPVVENKLGKQKLSYGMPSTHSATIMYYGMFVPLACAKLPIHPNLPTNPLFTRVIPPLLIVPYACTIAASRIWLGHHTWKQVLVGGSYGIAFAAMWYRTWVGGANEYGSELERTFNVLIDGWIR